MEQLKCKACGFIINEKKLGNICPACGVSRSAFEPYKENISKKRKTILGLNLHPIAVHFPQAFVTIIPPFLLLGVAVNPPLGHELLVTVKIAALLMPFTVAAAFICGVIDGKTRFKRLTTPYLKRKISAASVLLLLSAAMAVTVFIYGTEYPGRLILLLLSLGCIACEIYLAEIGKTLINSKLPG
ncbi:MAG TPA: rubrerythrin [Spirochaetota bacterium]|nr:rubrerythrin [Spirochaetota bacterium]